MNAHIVADTADGIVHAEVGTAAKVIDVTMTDELLHGDKGDTTNERNQATSDPATGLLWCLRVHQRPSEELPE